MVLLAARAEESCQFSSAVRSKCFTYSLTASY